MAPGSRPGPWESVLTRSDPAARKVPHRPPPVIVATDIGGVAVLKHGRRFLLSDELGDIRPDARGLGLYLGDTRVISHLELRLDDRTPQLLAADPGSASAGTILAAHTGPDGEEADLFGVAVDLDRSLLVRRSRRLDEGLDEEVAIHNPTDATRRATLQLAVDADFADLFEIRGHQRDRYGDHLPIEIGAGAAIFGYRGLDGRRIRVDFSAPGARIEAAVTDLGGAVVARWTLEPQPGEREVASWSIRLEVADPGAAGAGLDERAAHPRRRGRRPGSAAERPASIRARLPVDAGSGLADARHIESDDPGLDRIVRRGLADLDLLITPGPDPGERHLAAGAPWFVTLFGRDAIHASLATLPIDAGPAVDTLRVMARLQAARDDPTRDAEPGKMVHEIRDGEMARLGEIPFGRYYGSSDATPLWLILLGETYEWTGDLDLVRELWPAALAALAWLDEDGDLDRDGFLEYRRRAPDGLANQGWKDAVGAVRDRDGRIATGPIALVEVQAYAYDARVRVARLARLLGEAALAERLEADASRLRQRFEDAFWIPELGWYAIGLDGTKRPMDALASNQGHALWSGICAPERAALVAAWFGSERMDSGWGLRTLGRDQPGYSPVGYHTGTVWPHDTAIAVAGLRRYGQDEIAARLADGLVAAGRALPRSQLPELWCGFGRDEVDRPVPYPVACAPQAWSAAAPLLILRALLGLRPMAAEHRLVVERPRLPAGVRSLVLRDLGIGREHVSLAFRQRDDSVAVDVVDPSGPIDVDVRA